MQKVQSKVTATTVLDPSTGSGTSANLCPREPEVISDSPTLTTVSTRPIGQTHQSSAHAFASGQKAAFIICCCLTVVLLLLLGKVSPEAAKTAVELLILIKQTLL